MNQIIYIQKYIYIYNNDYVIKDNDLNRLFKINIKKTINKYKKLFNKDYCYKKKNSYLIKKEGVVLLSMIINSFYLIDITCKILDTFYILEKINYSILNRISVGIL